MSHFSERNKRDWEELERLVTQARRSIGRMSPEELSRLDVLYRRTAVHLARVNTRSSDRRLATYLNDLTSAAHAMIYLPHRKPLFAGLRQFVLEGFARSIARNWKPHALSALALVGGALLAYFAALADPLAAYALWPTGDIRQPGSTHDQLLTVLRSGRDQSGGEKFLFASFLFSHNLKVGLFAMALGVLAAIPTVLLMIYNGMILGVFAAIHQQAGIDSELWAWILPHGVTELGAIILCGGVGLILGKAVVMPGLLPRSDALRLAGHEAALTSLGVAGMLCLAAVIESYLRQSHLSTGARLAFAGGSALFWVLFIVHGFLRERAAQAVTAGSADAVQ